MIDENENLLSLSVDQTRKKITIWRIISLSLLVCLVTIIILYALGVGWKKEEKKKNKEEKEEEKDYESILSLWQPGSAVFTKLIPYIKKIIDVNSKDFIPVKDRIAASCLRWIYPIELCKVLCGFAFSDILMFLFIISFIDTVGMPYVFIQAILQKTFYPGLLYIGILGYELISPAYEQVVLIPYRQLVVIHYHHDHYLLVLYSHTHSLPYL